MQRQGIIESSITLNIEVNVIKYIHQLTFSEYT